MSEHPIPIHWLALHHDGELSAERCEQLEAHLPTCEICQRELAALQSLNGALAVDGLADDALTGSAVFWSDVARQLPGRTAAPSSALRWLPGVGLLLVNGLVQFLAAASLVVMLFGPLVGLDALSDGLGRWVIEWFVGWPALFLPEQWSGWGLALFFVLATAWLAVLYLAWLGYVWRYRRPPAASLVTSRG
jgi:anti-sigma factor RsiW